MILRAKLADFSIDIDSKLFQSEILIKNWEESMRSLGYSIERIGLSEEELKYIDIAPDFSSL